MKVTSEMRRKHYELFGYMVSDSEILDWIKSYKKQKKGKKK